MSPSLKTILAATDFSAPAERALQRAVQLAKAHGARLELVHTFDAAPVMPAWGDPGGGAWVGEKMFMDGVRDQLERSRERLAAEYGLPVQATLEVGPAHRQIARQAEQAALRGGIRKRTVVAAITLRRSDRHSTGANLSYLEIAQN